MLLYGGIGYAQNIPFGLLKPLFLFNNVQHQLQMTPPLDECFIPNPAFSPRSCATGLFEGEANIFEPYWAQWRVGAQLKDTLLTADEKDEVIKTAVIDSGISKEREAFQQMDVTCEKGADEEEICHGTQVASILCSKDHCSVGEAKNAQMYVYSAKEPLVDGMWDEDVADAIEDAIDHNARVINLSMIYFKSPNTLRIQRLMEKVKSSQVTLVWAAGNDFGQENLYPSNVDNLLSIASLNPYLGSSIFSNQGASTDFAAPSDYNMLSLEGRRFSGTSGAAPVVSGIILNMLKVNPNLTPPQIKNILKASSFDLNSTGFDHQTGWGMPNMVKALLAARYVREGRLNIPSVQVMSMLGVDRVLEMVNRLGITTLKDTNDYGLALVLGAGEVSLLELTNVYATFADNGMKKDPVFITKILDKRNQLIFQNKNTFKQVLSPEVAFLISSILSDAKTRFEEFGSALDNETGAAVKTGTTDDFRDSWTLGYTPDLAIGVWVGNSDNSSMDNIAGSLGAAPIWRELMDKFSNVRDYEFMPPSNIVQSKTCFHTAKKNSQQVTNEYFLKGTQPVKSCI
ncbi:MAG: Penicillin-binding protein, 1A family [Candidatus Gottesmanbacteria bacterium GW2011_GWC2_39_8]|uniref:peptidoglycan glycosyltransferase n=1 Tax=Candidatus Gottesmanbacteria bacterium GW2011_GWC2_39_8 TaxID=1618450 RepID=A0A0G0T7M2_9BACT|nr:MAG: Penicillin-binding protein, 1A family [Candidatus Gottesmanbacteria bacterium GW2011_GWC2_39_8]